MSAPRENRSHPRLELLAQVQVTRESEVYIMSTTNISRGGLFVQGDPQEYPDLRAGVRVEVMIFSAEDLDTEDVHLNANVVRVEVEEEKGNLGFGLQFVDLAPQQATVLDRLLRALELT